MNLYPFIELLPSDLKKRYITSLISSEGIIDEILWNEIVIYLVSSYKNVTNFKETVKMLLKEATSHDLDFIKNEVKKTHADIFEEMQDTILDLEDVVTLNATLVKKALNEFDKTKLIKATYIVSPTVIDYFQNLYPDIEFIDMREKIGNISVEEALEANKCVVATINANYCAF